MSEPASDPQPGWRIERDTMGEVAVPAEALWGAQTQRAARAFRISGIRVDPAVIRALALIKAEAAGANARLGVLPEDVAAAVRLAADEVAAGQHAEHFPVEVFQTGSGTSTNMNVNEVVATLAARRLGRPVHPNDHVNASQSSNDTFPSAVHLAAAQAITADVVPALEHLAATLRAKATETAHVVKAGRTHLMDATPVTLGQELGGYAAQIEAGTARLRALVPRLAELPLGGTAVGTGLNAPPGFAAAAVTALAARTGLPLTEAGDHFAAQGARDGLVEASAALRGLAVSLTKVCNDLRWMASGPAAGLAEIHLPDLQPGSSIMPGKVNPVVPEAVLQACAQVVGHDLTIAWAGASGNFELNVMVPVMARALLEQARLLAGSARFLADHAVAGLRPDPARARTMAQGSPAIATPLARVLGYEATAAVVKHALERGIAIRDAVRDLGHVAAGTLTEADLDRLLDVDSMTHPPPTA